MVTTGPPLEVLNDTLDEIDGARGELERRLASGANSADAADIYIILKDCAESVQSIRTELLKYSLHALKCEYAPKAVRSEKTVQDIIEAVMAGASEEAFMARFQQARAGKGLPVTFLTALETTLDDAGIPGETENRNGTPYRIKDLIELGIFPLQILADYINDNSKTIRVDYKSDKPDLLKPKNEWMLVLKSNAPATEPS